jgi:hypothetical protein
MTISIASNVHLIQLGSLGNSTEQALSEEQGSWGICTLNVSQSLVEGSLAWVTTEKSLR